MKMYSGKQIKHSKGFTLIEAMVTLLIFSAGLLGLAGMQMSGMQNSNSALLHTLAIQQTYDMAERIRANFERIRKDIANGSDYDDLSIETVTCITDANTACVDVSIAHSDFEAWYNTTNSTLPSGSGKVEGSTINVGSAGVPTKEYIITVTWVQPTGQNASVSLEFQP
ncbi:MAG: type IV pilus modification protein PilV [Gammaproteobacteria bacterium]|nr:type IV pilus modification protein PilV [Gammaproteobacteria bacterium]